MPSGSTRLRGETLGISSPSRRMVEPGVVSSSRVFAQTGPGFWGGRMLDREGHGPDAEEAVIALADLISRPHEIEEHQVA